MHRLRSRLIVLSSSPTDLATSARHCTAGLPSRVITKLSFALVTSKAGPTAAAPCAQAVCTSVLGPLIERPSTEPTGSARHCQGDEVWWESEWSRGHQVGEGESG